MIKEEYEEIIALVLMICLTFLVFYLVITFPTYFAGFFFGLLFYSSVDAFFKKDL